MNFDAIIATAIPTFAPAREFQGLFPDAEHAIVESKRDMDQDGWQSVYEWIARARLHDRYVIWLVVAVEIIAETEVSAIEDPKHYFVEVSQNYSHEGVDGPALQFEIGEFEEDGWNELVKCRGDFAALEFELKTDEPVDGFSDYWRDSNPVRFARMPDDAIALRAPYRFIT